MTGPEHYARAEEILRFAEPGDYAAAQVHAMLALAAAMALGRVSYDTMLSEDRQAWIRAASEKPGADRRRREELAAEAAELAGEQP